MNRLEEIIRPNVMKMMAYSSARDEFTDFEQQMIFLDANENPFQTIVNRYPDPNQSLLKKELSALKGIPESQILLGNGSDEVLDLLYRACCEPKEDNIIILPPTYGMYSVLANLNDVAIKAVNLTDDFQPAVTQILESVDTNTKLLFLCSPNNPTGNSFNENQVVTLLNTFKGIVVLDEAYIDFSSKKSWLTRLHEFPNLVITQTLSKAYGMAGIRLGICYASDEIIAVLKKIKPPYNVNQLSQLKALERLQNTKAVQEEIAILMAQRSLLQNALEKLSFVKKVYPSEANFLLVKVDDAARRYAQLIEKGIVIRNRAKQALCDNCLRFTVGTISENKTLISTLKTL
jgi:histidinol-phosphate aminotransferase